MMPDDQVQLRQLELEWTQFAVQQAVSREVLNNTKLSLRHDMLYDALIMRLRKFVLTDTFAHDTYTTELLLPANWWEHWKEQHGMKWLGPLIMRRWPVRTVARVAVVEVKRCLSYPEAKIERDPGGLGVVRILDQTVGPYWRPER